MEQRRTIVVTGGSSGIGLAAAAAFARGGADVVLLGRDPGRLRRAVEVVREAGGRTPAAYRADFAVLDEVRVAGARLAAEHERIDVLANNAGQLAPARRLTVDGFDPCVQVNHLAGFLLTHLLLDRLRAAAPARIITTGSAAEAWGTLDVRRPGRRQLSRWAAYGASKQANLLFTIEAARRWAPYGIVPTCFFPGLIRSGFGRRSPMFALGRLIFPSPERGADTLLWLADDPAAAVPGGYFAWRRPFGATGRSVDPDRARQLWNASLSAVSGTAVPGTAGTAVPGTAGTAVSGAAGTAVPGAAGTAVSGAAGGDGDGAGGDGAGGDGYGAGAERPVCGDG